MTKCHRYHLTLPSPTNVWVEMCVANPGDQDTDVLLLVFRVNTAEEITNMVTYTQHKVDNVSFAKLPHQFYACTLFSGLGM